MKKYLYILFFFFLINRNIYALENIRVVASLYEPFVYYKDGKLVGFDIDLLNKICEENNYRYSIEIVPFSKVLEKVGTGEADVGVGAIYVTEERKQKVSFTHPYLRTGLVFVSTLDFKGDIDELSNRKIGVKKNATGEKIAYKLCEKFHNCQVVSFNTTEASIDALVNKQVDLVLNDYINTHFLMIKSYRGKIFFVKGLFDYPKLITKDNIAFIVSKKRDDILFKFNYTMDKLNKEKYIENLLKFWPEIHTYPDMERVILIYAAFLGLIFIIIFLALKHYKDKEILKIACENEQFLNSILNNSPNIIIIHKDNGNITFGNKQFLNVYGEKFGGVNNLFDLYGFLGFNFDDLIKVKNFYNELFNDKKSFDIPNINALLENDRKVYDIQGAYIGNFKNQELYLTIIKDKTYVKELEEKFCQSQKLESIGRLAGGVAHDFNNFLTAISGFAYLSIINLDDREEVRKNLEKILNSSEKAANVTKQLLAFSRKQIAKPEIHNINDNIKDLEKVINKTVGEDIEVIIDLEQNLWSVKVDPSQIDQILMNLIVNARDAMPKGGKLIIRTRNKILDEIYVKGHPNVEKGEYVMIEIGDTGTGMTEEVKSHLFEPFFTTKEKGKGTGLGLATVYGIVKQNNGYIWVYSELGVGTTFKIYFPKCYEVEERVYKAKTDLSKEGRGKILLAEDDDMIREFIINTLKQNGYEVISAEDGLKALELFSKNDDITLVLSDLIMPKMSGMELIKKVKMIRPDVKILAMTGYSEEVLEDKIESIEDYPLLEKPFTALKLIETVKKLI